MVKQKLPHQEPGFTLVEVLVAILITTVFVAVAMQTIIIATVFRAHARQRSEATLWIQEDLENVKTRGSLPSTTLAAVPTTTTLTVASSTRFELGDQIKVGADPSTRQIVEIPSTTSIKLNAVLSSTPLFGVSVGVIKSKRCTLTTPATDTGFADYLQDNLPILSAGNLNSATKTITGATYTITRTPVIKPVSPYEVLELTYTVKKGSSPPIATTTTEVVPDAAFQCT